MPNGSRISGRTCAYAASGAVLGAILRYLFSTVWPIPPAFPAPPEFPTAGVASVSLAVGISLFVAGFTFTVVQRTSLRAFAVGVCAGVASLSHYAVIGVSTVAAAGVLVLIAAPICGLVGLAAGVFLALAFRARKSAVEAPEEARAE